MCAQEFNVIHMTISDHIITKGLLMRPPTGAMCVIPDQHIIFLRMEFLTTM